MNLVQVLGRPHDSRQHDELELDLEGNAKRISWGSWCASMIKEELVLQHDEELELELEGNANCFLELELRRKDRIGGKRGKRELYLQLELTRWHEFEE
jgi:hypothetical protein